MHLYIKKVLKKAKILPISIFQNICCYAEMVAMFLHHCIGACNVKGD